MDAPSPSAYSTHSDWIAAIDNRLLELRSALKAAKSHYEIIPYGSYDAQVCSLDQRLLKSQPDDSTWLIGAHTQPVLGVSSYFRGGSRFDLATCSQDASVSVWHVDVATQKVAQTHTLSGHDGAVEHVEFDPTGKLIATASWDGDIRIWDLSEGSAAAMGEGERKAKKSKSKDSTTSSSRHPSSSSSSSTSSSSSPNSNGSITQVESRSTLTGHMQCVSTLQWMDADQIVSGSWDHSLRFWDVESGVCTSHLDGNKVILSLDCSNLNQLIATGHADKTVRTWDPRVSIAASSLSTSYTSHTGWVSAVMWHPTDAHILVSGSFDSHIKIWDIRSSTPLHTLPSQHKDKVTTLAWLDNETFASAGADKYLRTYSFPRGSASD